MRTIKFRAYHKKQNRMFDVFGIGKDFVTEDTMDGIDPGNNCFQGNDLDDLELMQFTGLLDKNGKEIYKNDVLRFYNDNIEVVKFENGSFTVYDEPLGYEADAGYFEVFDTSKFAEVIGNIHQNPELVQ